jgi:hypothetical protein
MGYSGTVLFPGLHTGKLSNCIRELKGVVWLAIILVFTPIVVVFF